MESGLITVVVDLDMIFKISRDLILNINDFGCC